MPFAQRAVLALLGLTARYTIPISCVYHKLTGISVHAAPAAAPAPDAAGPGDQIGIGQPRFTVSWDLARPPPEPTNEPGQEPEHSEYPEYSVPTPKPSNVISLHPPSYSVSWDTPAPEPTSYPGYPEEPNDSVLPQPPTSDVVSLKPPSYSVSWDTPAPEPTEQPEYTEETKISDSYSTPSNVVSLKPPSYSVSWDTPAPEPTDPSEYPEETKISDSHPTASNVISLKPPSYSVSWDIPSSTPVTPPKSSSIVTPSKEPSITKYPATSSVKKTSTKKTRRPTPTPVLPSKSKSSVRSRTKKSTKAPSSTKKSSSTPSSTVKPTSSAPQPSSTKPTPTPSSSVRYTVSWDTPVPPSTKEPVVTPPRPSDSIGIQPPKVTVSWGRRQLESDPGATPEPEIPTDAEPEPEPEEEEPVEEDPEWPDNDDEPGGTIIQPSVVIPTPSNSIGIQPPRNTIIWGKRQFEYEPEPTGEPETPVESEEPELEEPEWPEEDPEWPEDDDESGGTIIMPPGVIPTPGNSIGIQPPKATIIWGKRQFEYEPEPTEGPQAPEPEEPDVEEPEPEPEEPEWPEEPEPEWPEVPEPEWPEEPDFPIELPPWIIPKPSNSIGIQPPKATIIWGRRKVAAETTSYGFEHTAIIPTMIPPLRPTSDVIWGKRQVDNEILEDPIDDPEEEPVDPIEDSTDFPDLPGLPTATPKDEVTMESPTATIVWGRRNANVEAAATTPDIGIVFPPNRPKPTFVTKPTPPVFVSWNRRDAAPEPTAAAVLANRAAEVPKSCALTTTVTRIRVCPAIKCTHECPVYPLEGTEYELVDPANEAFYERRDEPSEHAQFDCPVTATVTNKCPFCSCSPKTPLPTLTRLPVATLTPIVKTTKTTTAKTTSTYCPPAVITVSPPIPCDPPMCPHKELPCDYNVPVPLARRGRIARRGVVKPPVASLEPILPTKTTAASCKPSVTMTVAKLCPTYVCVPWDQCDAVQVVR